MLARAEQVKLLVLGKKSDQAGKKFSALLSIRCSNDVARYDFFILTHHRKTYQWPSHRTYDLVKANAFLKYKKYLKYPYSLGGCVAQRQHSCIPPSSPGIFLSENLSLYCSVCGKNWGRTHLVLYYGFHKCSQGWSPELSTTKKKEKNINSLAYRSCQIVN